MSRVVGRSFKISKNQARGYGYAKPGMKRNPGVTTIAAINGRGSFAKANRSARSVMSKLKQNARPAAARRALTASERAAFKTRMDRARAARHSPNRSTSSAQSQSSKRNIRKAQSARKAWGKKLTRGKRFRVGAATYGRKPKARRLKAGVYVANRRKRGVNAGLPADFDPRYQNIHEARAKAREEAYWSGRKKSSARKKRAGKKAGSNTMARRRKRASSGATKKRRSSKRRRKSIKSTSATPKRRRRRKAKKAGKARRKATTTTRRRKKRRSKAASPKRRRRSKARKASPKRRRRSKSRRKASPKRRRRSKARKASPKRRRRSKSRRKAPPKRRRGRKTSARRSPKRRRSSKARSPKRSGLRRYGKRRHRRNGRSLFRKNSAGGMLKMGAILFGGFALHRLASNLLSNQLLSRLLPPPAAPAATSGFDLSGQRGLIASLAVGVGGAFVASKVIKNEETKKLIIGGIVASTLHGVVMSVLKAFSPPAADMLAGPEDATAARLAAMYGLGGAASIMPNYQSIGRPVRGVGEYFAANGLGEYFATPANGLGEYFAATNGLGTYESNSDLMQAAAGMGSHDYQGNHIDPSGDLDRELTIAEAAAGVGELFPYSAAAGMGNPMQAAAGFGAISTVSSGDTWIPGTTDGQLWAGTRAITNGQAANEMQPAGVLETQGGQGIFG